MWKFDFAEQLISENEEYLGKDISEMQTSGQSKPALVVRDLQWQGDYNASKIYYKDDRVYYSGYGTCMFMHDWLETETPTAGFLPTNLDYWSYLSPSNLGGGSYSEIGSDGIFSNGRGVDAMPGSSGILSNIVNAALLQHRNGKSNGISAAVIGFDQTSDSDGVSKSYGGWFNRLKVEGILENYHAVTGSTSNYTVTKNDCVIHSFSTVDVTLYLPVPSSNGADIGLTFKVKRCSGHNILLATSSGVTIQFNTTEQSSSLWITDGYEHTIRCAGTKLYVETI